jgi:GH25 family lysozyme M1 (1,4-beta-N-acetylmuramidase)
MIDGLVRGAYHFARPSRNAPEPEAAHFLTVLQAAGGLDTGDLIALDLEDTDVAASYDALPWAMAWLRTVEAETGVRPLLYSGWWYLQPHISDISALRAYAFWLADYGADRPERADLWQHSNQGSVPGVAGACDLDCFYGDVEDLRRLGKPAPPKEQAAAGAGDKAGTLATVRDVAHGWGERLAAATLTPEEQAEAGRELLSVAAMIEGLWRRP